MAAPEQFSDQTQNIQQAKSGDVLADLLTQERTQKLDLLIHLITNLNQSLIVCGPQGSGKTALLELFQVHYAKVWPIVFLSANEQLSFEQIQVQLLKRLAPPGSGKGAQSLNSLLQGLEKLNRPLVLVCDDAGRLCPGLMTTLMQYAAAFPRLRMVFALKDDELAVKRNEDPAIDKCHFIEIPALAETQYGEYWQYWSDKMQAVKSQGDQDVAYGSFQAHEHEVNYPLKEQSYMKTKGIFGRIDAALPDLKGLGMKGFSGLHALVVTGILLLCGSFWVFKNTTPIADKSASANSTMSASTSLVIPGQTAPEPEFEPTVPAVVPVKPVNKPLLPELNAELDFYKGHGRSLEGDALTEFELNKPLAAEAFEPEQLKVEIIPSEPVHSEPLVAGQALPPVATGYEDAEAVAKKSKQAGDKKLLIDKKAFEKAKPLQLQADIAAKKQAERLIKLELAKKLKLKALEKIRADSSNVVAVPEEGLKPLAVTPKVKVVATEKAASIARPKNPPVKAAQAISDAAVELAVTQPTLVAPIKPKAIKSAAPLETASAKPAGSRYTLQLVSFTQPALLAAFMRKHSAMGAGLRTIKVNKAGKEQYLVVYGTFDSSAQASAAKRKLPAEFSQAWPRKM